MTHTDRHHGHAGHSHESDQGHPAGWFGRLRHDLSGLVGDHSHDAADQIDDALEANAAGRRTLSISLVALGITAGLQAGLW